MQNDIVLPSYEKNCLSTNPKNVIFSASILIDCLEVSVALESLKFGFRLF